MDGTHTDDLADRDRASGVGRTTYELAHRLARAEELPGQIDANDGIPIVEGHRLDRRIALQAGVGDDDIQGAKDLHHSGEHLDDLVLPAYVGPDRDRAAPHRRDLADHLVGRRLICDKIHRNIRAGPGQAHRHGPSDAGVGAGDQCRLTR